MLGKASVRLGLGLLFVSGCTVFFISGIASCGTAPTPFVISGPGQFGNELPTLDITEPVADITVGQGDPFLIRWADTDRDNNASISFLLVNTATNDVIILISNISEDADGTTEENHIADTTFIPPGAYNLLGTIDDGVNSAVDVFARVAGDIGIRRVVVTVAEPGVIPPTIPPIVAVTSPVFNLSVSQDDVLEIVVQPRELAAVQGAPFDPDSPARLFILLDVDLNPNNDDPANPDPAQIIVLEERNILAGSAATETITELIDLELIPARPSGEPYFIRATIDDLLNPPVHSYAAGSISVVQLAAGSVDLFDIGRTKSGARFQGFNPGARLGSKVEGVSDFDGVVTDGVSIADFVMVAQFGNPQNLGPIGEAYLVYGRDRLRFGGTISVNSISNTVSGVIFQAPPVRDAIIQDGSARTNGITDVGMIPDLTGDGKPEILFGLAHVHGAYSSMDYDPGDTDADGDGGPGCYQDLLVNNFAEDLALDIDGWYAGGMVVIFNSSNRDSDGLTVTVDIARLDSTALPLEFVGQLSLLDSGAILALDGGGFSSDNDTSSANVIARSSPEFADDRGTDPAEENRQAGARFIPGGFDFIDAFGLGQPAREGLFGQSVASLGDLDADNRPEFIFSAPNNEAYFNSLAVDFGTISTHAASTIWRHNIVIIPGNNYNIARRGQGDGRTSSFPSFDGTIGSTCQLTGVRRDRILDFPPEAFQIIQEDINDRLGDGQSAGDFNRDGLDDILCGAPLNDRSASQIDSGATYIVFGRSVFGDVDLGNANDPSLRPPMLRIRGINIDDQIGWGQTAGLDVNGDRIDDVFIGSPRTDFGGVTGECRDDVDANGVIDANDYVLATFEDCVANFGNEVFLDDPCKVFDFDNDRDIDQGDRCIFCCLSDDCTPDTTCALGRSGAGTCCDNVVNNGFVGVIFGGVFIDGDRDLSQLATSQLPGTRFYGGRAGDQAGHSISSAGDFNQDGFGDILITAPGRTIIDSAGRERLGVVYLIFGGTHLINTTWNLDQVGDESGQLPGMVFFSPYVSGRPNEAPPTAVGFIGDINNDGFGDIGIGNDRADFIDPTFPQGPDAPGSDSATGRRSDVGDVYIVYGNNFSTNRATTP